MASQQDMVRDNKSLDRVCLPVPAAMIEVGMDTRWVEPMVPSPSAVGSPKTLPTV